LSYLGPQVAHHSLDQVPVGRAGVIPHRLQHLPFALGEAFPVPAYLLAPAAGALQLLLGVERLTAARMVPVTAGASIVQRYWHVVHVCLRQDLSRLARFYLQQV
jgi:hypothetical protein